MENSVVEIMPPAPAPPAANDKISYEEFLKWNGEKGWYEWVDGKIIKMSNPTLKHQDISDFLTAILRFFVEAKNCGRIISAPFQVKFDFRPSGRQPGVMFVSNENLPRLRKTFVEGTADLIVEIISPESRGRDRGEKFYEYEQAGVKELWLIDADRKQAEFFVLDDKGIFQAVLPVDGKFESRVLNGVFIITDWLWQEELPSLIDVLKDWKLV
ncbi:MAG: Uma2 family endonuclease [Pyrinomonadaceae bacterium]